MTGELCEAVTDLTDSMTILRQLDSWEQGQVNLLHVTAGKWLEENEYLYDAMDH